LIKKNSGSDQHDNKNKSIFSFYDREIYYI
jgi:hypothetical protein